MAIRLVYSRLSPGVKTLNLKQRTAPQPSGRRIVVVSFRRIVAMSFQIASAGLWWWLRFQIDKGVGIRVFRRAFVALRQLPEHVGGEGDEVLAELVGVAVEPVLPRATTRSVSRATTHSVSRATTQSVSRATAYSVSRATTHTDSVTPAAQ